MLEKIFPRNLGTADRLIRIVAGLFMLSLVFVGPKSLFGLVGLVPLVTGAIGSCALYRLCGASTCPVNTRR